MVKDCLAQFKENCLVCARRVGNYMDYTLYPRDETKIANNYLHAKAMTEILRTYYSAVTNYNELLAKYEADMDSYMAMLILRHWKDIKILFDKCKTVGHGDALEDYSSIVVERILYALKYEAWNKEDSTTNAQACINMAIATEKKNQYYFSNLDKNKANVNTYSLDTTLNVDSDDKETTLADTLPDENTRAFSKADCLVKMYVDNNKLVEAVVLESIANGDTVKVTTAPTTFTVMEKDHETGKYVEVECKGKDYYQEFWRYRAAQILMNLPEDYEEMFSAKFHVAYDVICEVVGKIRTAKNQKIYRYLDSTIASMQAKKSDFIELLTTR